MTVIIMAGIGYFALVLLALYITCVAFATARISLGFTGKMGFECFVTLAFAVLLWTACYFAFPFQLAISVAPIGVK